MDRTKSPVQTDGKSLCLYMFQCICFKVKSLTNLVSCHQKVKIPGFRWRPRSSHFKSLLKMPQNGFTFTIQPKKMSVTTHIVEDVHLQSCFRLCMKLTSLSEPIWIRKHTLLRTHTNKHVIQGRHAISEGEESECVSCPGQVLWVFWDSVLCSRAKLCSAVFWKLIHFTMFLSRNSVLDQNLSSFQPNQSNHAFSSLWQLIARPYLNIWELLKGTEAAPWACPHTSSAANTPTQTDHPGLVNEKHKQKEKDV